MLQRVSVWVLVAAIIGAAVPAFAAMAKAKQGEGSGRISGVALDSATKPLANVTARLRNVDSGQLVGETKTNARGEYTFTGLNPGRFVVEIVSDKGDIIGTTSAISLTVGAMVATGVTVTATAAAAGATAAAAAAAGGGFFSSTAGLIVIAAAGAGIAGGVAIAANSSPSR
jgi:hypothetical protein